MHKTKMKPFISLYPSILFPSTDTGRAVGCPNSTRDRILSADTLQRFTRSEKDRSGGMGGRGFAQGRGLARGWLAACLPTCIGKKGCPTFLVLKLGGWPGRMGPRIPKVCINRCYTSAFRFKLFIV